MSNWIFDKAMGKKKIARLPHFSAAALVLFVDSLH